MTTSIGSIHIEAPVEKVFTFVKDPANVNRLPHAGRVKDVQVTRGGVGTNYTWRPRYQWLPVEGLHVCTEYVPNKRMTFKSSHAFDGTVIYAVEREGTGTRFTISMEPRSIWSAPVVGDLWARLMQRGHQVVLADVKAALETEDASAA